MPSLGQADATYKAAGKERGIRRLVETFYEIMSTHPDFATIWSWHTETVETAADKLSRFLCGWMGGPRLYQEAYGAISIPRSHSHLNVTETERDQWLECMRRALAQQDYPDELVQYLLVELAKPAEMIRRTSQTNQGGAL
jgi:hemoglobin